MVAVGYFINHISYFRREGGSGSLRGNTATLRNKNIMIRLPSRGEMKFLNGLRGRKKIKNKMCISCTDTNRLTVQFVFRVFDIDKAHFVLHKNSHTST